MIYLVTVVLVIISYFIGKADGVSEGEGKSDDLKYYLYAPQIDLYEQGFKDGERRLKERLFK